MAPGLEQAGHVNFACKDVDVKNPDDMESESRTIKEWKKHVGLSADDDVLSQVCVNCRRCSLYLCLCLCL